MADQPNTPNADDLRGALKVPLNVQVIYSNGATLNLSQADMQVVFNTNGRPVMAVAMSLPVAKHLKNSLDNALKTYERKTNTIIPDVIEIGEQLKKP